MNDKKVQRIIDANFNRAKEGLRVCEDICRFIYNKKDLTGGYKAIRHDLTKVMQGLGLLDIIRARDIENDVGKRTISSELKRRNISDILYANSQRVKESIRVLEEFAKLLTPRLAMRLKDLRYKLYALERKIVKKT
ncbi:MAG: hypothetical protein A2Z88_05855 [Omnitrophica WOR_2 bacterium GWA2_47_8]|nr:MAG: hypothetical protein A2Z88_05855 [Omnitrophica WOR_2 bacterium GWA2_47_8]